MRTLASLAHYFASVDERGLQIHQYGSAQINAAGISVAMTSDYPWSGGVSLVVEDTPREPWRLSLRIPGWAPAASVRVNGERRAISALPGSYVDLELPWRPGDRVELDLDLGPRLLAAHPWIESSRGCVAIQRGPLVYCVEQIDHTPH